MFTHPPNLPPSTHTHGHYAQKELNHPLVAPPQKLELHAPPLSTHTTHTTGLPLQFTHPPSPLPRCIRALDMGSSHVPFRGSKLTHILRDSFTAADSRTAMLVHLSPAARATEQSLNSLRYAERLKAATARMAPQGAAAPPVSRTPSRARRVSCLLPQERVEAAEPCGPVAAHPPAVRVACDDGGAGPVEEGVPDEGRCRETLLTVVDCLYDPDAWAEERGRLALEGTGSIADLAAHGERLDLLLAERIELLEALRAKIGAWRR